MCFPGFARETHICLFNDSRSLHSYQGLSGSNLAQEGDRSGFRRSRAPMFGRNMTLLALQKPGAPNYFSILRPNTGESFFDMEVCCPGLFAWNLLVLVA